MGRLACRGSIALGALVVALFSTRPAQAQYGNMPGPPQPRGHYNDFATGIYYDVANQSLAEKQIRIRQGLLRHHAERGNAAAVDRDNWRLRNLQYRIVVDEWLIRQNSLVAPGLYPYPVNMDPLTCAAIAQAHGRR